MTDPFTYADVERELVVPHRRGPVVDKWHGDRTDADMVAHVLGFEHRTLPTLDAAAVGRAMRDSGPALESLEKVEHTDYYIDEVNVEWTFTYLYHDLLEELGMVPRWYQFRDHLRGAAADKWWDPVWELAMARGKAPGRVKTAMHWRMATGWQSLIRTTWALATLRHTHGVDVRYHEFAHVVLRLDGWVPGRGYRLVMRSPHERKKTTPEQLFAGTRFATTVLEVPTSGTRGKVWLPREPDVAALAAWLAPDQDPRAHHPQQMLPGFW